MSSLNVQGNIIGSGTAITNLNYNAIINKPDLTGYAINTNIDSLSSSSFLAINNLNTSSSILLNNLNSFSTSSILAINNLNATSSTLFTTKQNNLTFSNPFLNTSNTVSLKYDNTKLNIDASGNLTVINGTSQWTTTGPSIFYNGGSSSQPWVRIEQTTTWRGISGNYGLQVVGYSDFNGIRMMV